MTQQTTPSIPDLARATAAERAGQAAILFPGHQVTFDEVDQRSDAVAGYLSAAGVEKGDRIGIYCINSAEFAITYLGVVKAGAVVVPVNLLQSASEVQFVLQNAGAKAIFYHTLFAEKVAEVRVDLPQLEFAVCIGDEPLEGDEGFAAVLQSEAQPPHIEFDPAEDLAAILYTSGTTGQPKGAMLTHRNLVSNTRSVLSALGMQPGQDRLLVVLPMFHSFAATVGTLTPLLHGVSLAPVPKFDPQLVTDVIAATGATIFLGVPSMYSVLLRLTDEEVKKWQTIRYCVSGGAAMPVAVMEQFESRFSVPVLEGDGPTECSPVTCVNPLNGTRKPASVGLPIPDVEMQIFDARGKTVPRNEIGEICVRGPNVMKGYWNLPEATAETFFEDWVRTGDLGYLDDEGYVYIVDRLKDMVIVNGMNVYPRMVEEALYRHPGIAEAAVVGEPSELHGEIVVAHVVTKTGEALAAAEVKAFCRENLGRHEVPRKVVVREALPKNATGKILKRELRLSGELERGIDSREKS